MKQQTGIIILAAGSSSRLGKPKQLLQFEGKSLLHHIVEKANSDPTHHTVVVLGSNDSLILHALQGLQQTTIVNTNWHKGMGSSIKAGLQALLLAAPNIDRCIITVCDQPFVDHTTFKGLKDTAENQKKGIIATGFKNTWGVPVLFSKDYFEQLSLLSDQDGAKKMIAQYTDDLALFPFEPAQFDIDTPADYYQLKHQMISVQEAKDNIAFHLPQPRIQTAIALPDSLGYVLATDIKANISIPGFAQSSMDGYALQFTEKDQALSIVDEIPAGTITEKTLFPGQCMRIFTGAPLPRGADTVVMQEKITIDAKGKVHVVDSELQSGMNVRPIGSEVAQGALAIQAGSVLSPAAIGYLAGIGCTQVNVFTAPHIGLILTGDELLPLGSTLAFGQVYESNSHQLEAALKQMGIHEIRKYHVKDDPSALKITIEQALEHCDILMLVGGVSVGDYDFVTQVVQDCGVKQHFHRIRQKPGKPLFFGSRKEQLIFGLPGNPSSALTCFYLYVAPVIDHLLQRPASIKSMKTTINYDYHKKAGLTHFLKGYFDGNTVQPLHAQESYRLQSFAQANCLIVIPEDTSSVCIGDQVMIQLL